MVPSGSPGGRTPRIEGRQTWPSELFPAYLGNLSLKSPVPALFQAVFRSYSSCGSQPSGRSIAVGADLCLKSQRSQGSCGTLFGVCQQSF